MDPLKLTKIIREKGRRSEVCKNFGRRKSTGRM